LASSKQAEAQLATRDVKNAAARRKNTQRGQKKHATLVSPYTKNQEWMMIKLSVANAQGTARWQNRILWTVLYLNGYKKLWIVDICAWVCDLRFIMMDVH
jgi:hypothetical protein